MLFFTVACSFVGIGVLDGPEQISASRTDFVIVNPVGNGFIRCGMHKCIPYERKHPTVKFQFDGLKAPL